MKNNKRTCRNRYFDEYCDFLRQRTDCQRKAEGKMPYSDATIETIARDTFYLERHEEDHDFMEWILGMDESANAWERLAFHLAHRRTPEADVKYYLRCMQLFQKFHEEIGQTREQ